MCSWGVKNYVGYTTTRLTVVDSSQSLDHVYYSPAITRLVKLWYFEWKTEDVRLLGVQVLVLGSRSWKICAKICSKAQSAVRLVATASIQERDESFQAHEM